MSRSGTYTMHAAERPCSMSVCSAWERGHFLVAALSFYLTDLPRVTLSATMPAERAGAVSEGTSKSKPKPIHGCLLVIDRWYARRSRPWGIKGEERLVKSVTVPLADDVTEWKWLVYSALSVVSIVGMPWLLCAEILILCWLWDDAIEQLLKHDTGF